MELLAPAGNFQSLKAAVACGADAVYLGAEKYGARASAENFDRNALSDALEFSHMRGVKVYLTVNTLIKDSEMSDAVAKVKAAHQMGVDAFLIQDLGLLTQIRQNVPDATLHASTQMGICNADGAAFAKQLGIRRVVVARETLPADIAEIKRTTALEVEMFCHGALCVAYSGNCYYSSLVSGCSGNRGRCLQLCRKPYTREEKSGYFLSAKDICLIDKVAELKALGVDSLKIEGRMRAPEYVAETVSVYRKAIDGQAVTAEDITRLKTVFNRGDYCKAYFAHPTENVIYSKTQNHIGQKCGTVKSVRNGKLLLEADGQLCVGDGVKYVRNGYEVGGGLIDGIPTTGYRGNVHSGDDVCLTSSIVLRQRVAALDARLPVDVSLSVSVADGAQITLCCQRNSVTLKSNTPVVRAVHRAVTEAELKDAIGTLGGTDFSLQTLSLKAEEGIFFPMSQLKALRKLAVEKLKSALLSAYPITVSDTQFALPHISWLPLERKTVFVQVPSPEILDKLTFAYDYAVIAPQNYQDYALLQQACERLNSKAVLYLPFIVRDADKSVLKKLMHLPFAAYVANNISHLQMFAGKTFIGGIGLNHLNAFYPGTFIQSVESETQNPNDIQYAYGKIPLMHFSHCPRKNQGHSCNDCHGYMYRMQDDKGAHTEFHRIKEHYCYSVLISSIPRNTVKIGNTGSFLLDLTYATEEEIRAVNMQISQNAPYGLPCTQGNRNRKLQ